MIPIVPIRTSADLDEAVAASRDKDVLVYKHSTRCSVSAWAQQEFTAFLGEPAALRFAAFQVDVIASKALSQEVATRFSVRHESPQLLVLRDGRVIAHGSHDEINRAFLRGLDPRKVA
ncbi:MAG: bacillithiol system redox-active protein YtxJ [Planctomycetes bacterium]|nr:bacillithiol system redox-active protein YtxJ [Planctomycetota bacterium]MBI3845440.1 bacillithiol system redox-active protein YtxJ [Planctomycetota bacterium]